MKLALLFVVVLLGLTVVNADSMTALDAKLQDHMASKSADFVKLPPLSQQQVIKAFREILLRTVESQKTGELNLNISSTGLPCWVCERAVHWLIDHANDWACDAAFDAIATIACQAAGLGPWDPWSDLCTGLIIAGCGIIIRDIEHHITNDKRICKDIHLC
jgi:hypothetical protein